MLTARELLLHTQVPEHPCMHLLGSLETRLTVYSQQTRAFNLIYSLFAQERLQPGDALLVVGGGVSGLTAAAAAARCRCRVTLLEQNELLHLFANCQKRWIHPHIYDWPSPGSLTADTADLPLLRWQAGEARTVVDTLLREWTDIQRSSTEGAIEVHTRIRDVALAGGGSTSQTVSWNPGNEVRQFRAVILAVGFGLERTIAPLPSQSYWRDDDLDQDDLGGRAARILVSGYGDGGLTDALRATLRGFRHDSLVGELGLDFKESTIREPARQLGEKLLAIEAVAARQPTVDAAAEALKDGYARLDAGLATLVDDRLRQRIRGRSVVLNGPGSHPLTLASSVLNRFLVWRLIKLHAIDVRSGQIQPNGVEPHAGGAWRVTFADRTSAVYDRVILRHGAVPALAAAFPSIWEQCKEKLKPRNELDQTRFRIWPDGWFENAARVNAVESPKVPPGPAKETLFSVPHDRKRPRLVGRGQALVDARERLVTTSNTERGVSLRGIGGLGKTQLAVEYAYHFRAAYPGGVIWLNADQDIDAQLGLLATQAAWAGAQATPGERLTIAKRELRTRRDCLLIFDDVADVRAIEPYLPAVDGNAHILITSLTEQRGFPPVAVGLLSVEDSLTLLLQEANRAVDPHERDIAQDIANRLGGLPLALELAGAYLKQRPRVGWAEYLALLEASLREALPGRLLASATRHEADLYATLRVSEDVFDDEPRLRDILDVLSWSGSGSMSVTLLAAMLAEDTAPRLIAPLSLGVELRILTREEAIPGTSSGPRYRIHNLVREVRREEIPLVRTGVAGATLAERLGEWFEPRSSRFEDLATFTSDFEHLQAWQKHAVKHGWGSRALLTWQCGYPAYSLGRYRESMNWVADALALHVQTPGAARRRVAELEHELGMLHRALGESEQAFAHIARGLSILDGVAGKDDLDVARGHAGLAFVYRDRGELQQALEHDTRALEIRKGRLGDQHAVVAATLNTLGLSCMGLGRTEEAREYHTRALAIRLAVLEPRHPDIATTYANLADLALTTSNLEDAHRYATAALEIRRERLGAQHPLTGDTFVTLGVVLSHRRQHEGALENVKAGLDILRAAYPDPHPKVADAWQHLGEVYSRVPDFEAALLSAETALAINRRCRGDAHTSTRGSLVAVVTCLVKLQRWDEALARLDDAIGRVGPDSAVGAELEEMRPRIVKSQMATRSNGDGQGEVKS